MVVPSRHAAPAKTSAEVGQFARLRWLNVAAGVFHLLQGVLVLVLSNNFSLPVTTSFIEFDEAAGELVPSPATAFELPIGPLVAAFLLMSAAAQLILAAPGVFGWYARNLRRGINYARWAEYAFSASLMLVVIAMLAGLYDAAALLLLFALNATVMLFGLLMELLNLGRARPNWTPFWFGVIAAVVTWVTVGLYLLGAGGEGGGVPTFVYFIYASLFLLFNSFAVNIVLQYRRVGPWRDYLFGERAYIVLSLVAKSALAWQVFAGTLRPV